jgi:hypothetical protein
MNNIYFYKTIPINNFDSILDEARSHFTRGGIDFFSFAAVDYFPTLVGTDLFFMMEALIDPDFNDDEYQNIIGSLGLEPPEYRFFNAKFGYHYSQRTCYLNVGFIDYPILYLGTDSSEDLKNGLIELICHEVGHGLGAPHILNDPTTFMYTRQYGIATGFHERSYESMYSFLVQSAHKSSSEVLELKEKYLSDEVMLDIVLPHQLG